MKSILLPIFSIACLFPACKSSQKALDPPLISTSTSETEGLEAIISPEFPGGMDLIFKYFRENLIYPPADKKNGIQGTSFVQFTVSETGELSDIHIYQEKADEATEAMNEEALRLVSSMPNWTPGTENGEPVATRLTLPIRFVLR